jgi:hypothetical protein
LLQNFCITLSALQDKYINLIKPNPKKMDNQILRTKIQKGDFKTLAAMLGINSEAARKRFSRKNKEAVEGMKKIINTRETLIKKSKTPIEAD